MRLLYQYAYRRTIYSSACSGRFKRKNTRQSASARLSETFDFKREDAIPDLIFSQVIWKPVKGEESMMPAPIRSAFLRAAEEEGEDEKEEVKTKPKSIIKKPLK